MSYTQQDAKKESDAIVIKAIEMATEFHKRDVRKGTVIPYLSHLFNVCKILAERDCRAELIATALLHDIVEDTCFIEYLWTFSKNMWSKFSGT